MLSVKLCLNQKKCKYFNAHSENLIFIMLKAIGGPERE